MVNLKAHGHISIVYKPRLFSVGVLLCFLFLNFAICNGDDHEETATLSNEYSEHHFRMSCMMLSYVKSKGCEYIKMFVKNHYFAHHHSLSSDHRHSDMPMTCNWEPWVEKKCMDYHIPPELCCALIDCGISKSMDAFDISVSSLGTCNLTTHLIGKRSPRLCDPEQSGMHMCQLKKRNTELGETEISSSPFNSKQLTHNNIQSKRSENTSLLNNISQTTTSLNLIKSRLPNTNRKDSLRRRKQVRKWCKVFSRRVNKKYHLHEAKFLRQSVYWVVDIYRAARRNHVPKSYTHGLVGCGMQYAMVAFNVEKWQRLLYNQVLE